MRLDMTDEQLAARFGWQEADQWWDNMTPDQVAALEAELDLSMLILMDAVPPIDTKA